MKTKKQKSVIKRFLGTIKGRNNLEEHTQMY